MACVSGESVHKHEEEQVQLSEVFWGWLLTSLGIAGATDIIRKD